MNKNIWHSGLSIDFVVVTNDKDKIISVDNGYYNYLIGLNWMTAQKLLLTMDYMMGWGVD